MSNDFSRFAPINLGLIPVLIDMGADAGQTSTRETLSSLLDICRDQLESAPDRLMWRIATDALERAIEGSLSISALSESNPQWLNRHQEEHEILCTYALGVTAAISPRDLWLAEGRIARWISGFYRHLGNLGPTVCSSIAQSWQTRITRNGYLYRHPQYTMKRIQEAADEVHLGKVLSAVAEALDLNLSDEYREVLSSCSMTRR